MEQERKQKPREQPQEQRPAPVNGTGEGQQLRDTMERALAGQDSLEERLAVATRQILEKGILSATAAEAAERLDQGQQETGE